MAIKSQAKYPSIDLTETLAKGIRSTPQVMQNNVKIKRTKGSPMMTTVLFMATATNGDSAIRTNVEKTSILDGQTVLTITPVHLKDCNVQLSITVFPLKFKYTQMKNVPLQYNDTQYNDTQYNTMTNSTMTNNTMTHNENNDKKKYNDNEERTIQLQTIQYNGKQ